MQLATEVEDMSLFNPPAPENPSSTFYRAIQLVILLFLVSKGGFYISDMLAF